jgi:hypothetical protein
MLFEYDKGDMLRTVATFTNAASGLSAIPSTVVFRFMNPAGQVSTYRYGDNASVAALASNAFVVEHPLDASGDWHVRVEGLGTNAAADEFSIYVKDSEF